MNPRPEREPAPLPLSNRVVFHSPTHLGGRLPADLYPEGLNRNAVRGPGAHWDPIRPAPRRSTPRPLSLHGPGCSNVGTRRPELSVRFRSPSVPRGTPPQRGHAPSPGEDERASSGHSMKSKARRKEEGGVEARQWAHRPSRGTRTDTRWKPEERCRGPVTSPRRLVFILRRAQASSTRDPPRPASGTITAVEGP